MKYLITALILFGQIVSQSVIGCTRNPAPQNLQQVEEWYGFSGYVFVAHVQTVSSVSPSEEEYSLRILETFKGDFEPTEIARTSLGSTCSVALKLDQRYLLFAGGRQPDGRLSISGAVVPLDRATDFVRTLRELAGKDSE